LVFLAGVTFTGLYFTTDDDEHVKQMYLVLLGVAYGLVGTCMLCAGLVYLRHTVDCNCCSRRRYSMV